MMTELRSSLPLIAELLRETAAEAQFRQLAFLQQAAAEAAQFPESWDAALSADSALSPEELSVLQTVGQTLGSMPLDGQLAALQLCLERLAQLQADAELCARSKGRLYRSMGFLGAVFCVVLLL
jgi:stage III sporulation protein AB